MDMIVLDRAVLARFNRYAKEQANGCWIWMGTDAADGYARWRYKPGARLEYVHVWAYRAFNGPITTGMQVDHACHTADTSCPGGQVCIHRRCCNPQHLELVTPSENTLRQRHANRLKTDCGKCGRALEGDNLTVWKDGKRRCAYCLRHR